MNPNPIKKLPIAHTLSLDVGIIHLVGIGGIGMSSIAEILHNLGYMVQGSDMSDNANVARLKAMGINVFIGQSGGNIGDASVVVKSTAVKMDNPEIIEARQRRIPVVRRSDMLAELVRLKMSIAIAGTHGKTTTTSLTACLLEAAELNPTVINGGIINAYGTNARLGKGEWMVVEADESDGTFIKLPATIGVITNIDPEHLDHYGSFDGLRDAFRQFVDNLPFYGFAVLCVDHPEVQSLAAKITDRRLITYGENPQADIRAINIRADADGQYCDVVCNDPISNEQEIIKDLHLPMHGKHNLMNSMAALCVARELGIDTETILRGFSIFGGVKRRFTKVGEVGGITIIDDYAHHPVEISATLASARQARPDRKNKVIAVMQPHRYTRLRDLFEDFCKCFNDADIVLITSVFEAGEEAIEGYDRDSLVEGIRQHGHKNVMALPSKDALASIISNIAKTDDMVVCLGAGTISLWANELPEEIQNIIGKDND